MHRNGKGTWAVCYTNELCTSFPCVNQPLLVTWLHNFNVVCVPCACVESPERVQNNCNITIYSILYNYRKFGHWVALWWCRPCCMKFLLQLQLHWNVRLFMAVWKRFQQYITDIGWSFDLFEYLPLVAALFNSPNLSAFWAAWIWSSLNGIQTVIIHSYTTQMHTQRHIHLAANGSLFKGLTFHTAPTNITTKIEIQFCIDYFDLVLHGHGHTERDRDRWVDERISNIA